jgi:hypothetical protein
MHEMTESENTYLFKYEDKREVWHAWELRNIYKLLVGKQTPNI